jgi:hypothetical protein
MKIVTVGNVCVLPQFVGVVMIKFTIHGSYV